jgi:hypothetical protein
MKAQVLGIDIDMGWKHLLLVISALLIFGIVGAILSFQDWMLQFTYTIGLLGPLLLAFVYLKLAPVFGFKRDEGFCRNCASVNFLVLAVMSALGFIMMALSDLSAPIWFLSGLLLALLSSIAGGVAGGITIYLWMLLLLKGDREKVVKAAWYAVAFAALMFLIGAGYAFLSLYASGDVYVVDIWSVSGLAALGNMFFGFILLYNFPKALGRWAKLFAVAYMGSSLLADIASFLLDSFAVIGPGLVSNLVNAVFALGLIYVLGRHMLSGKPLA